MTTMRVGDYVAEIEFDESTDQFHGIVLHTRDVLDFYGASAADLRREFEKTLDVYFEVCREKNRKPEKPYSGKFQVRLTPEQHRAAVIAAASEGKSLNEWVAATLEQKAMRSR